ncbi:MAG: hypothetical protein QM793_02715 [Muricomes sp.]
MKYFKVFYNCSIWAMVIALSCFHNTWLQMRINTGYVFYGSGLVLTILICITAEKWEPGIFFTIINVILSAVYGYVLYGWKRLQVVPASLLREGIHQPVMKFAAINGAIFAFLIAGLLLIILQSLLRKKRQERISS